MGRMAASILYFIRTNKVSLKLKDDKATEKALLDLDAVLGLTEINLEVEEAGLKYIIKLGVSSHSSYVKVVPPQVVSLSTRYVVLNESGEVITLRQCILEGKKVQACVKNHLVADFEEILKEDVAVLIRKFGVDTSNDRDSDVERGADADGMCYILWKVNKLYS